MSKIEGATKQRSPVVTWSVLAAWSKKATFVKPYPPYLKSLCRYGGFVPSSWQNACNAAHDHHSPFAGGLRHLQSRYYACFSSIENGTGRPGNERSTVSATKVQQKFNKSTDTVSCQEPISTWQAEAPVCFNRAP